MSTYFESICNKNFISYNNARVKHTLKRCIFKKTKPDIQGIVVKDIIAIPAVYDVYVTTHTNQNLYWFGNYDGYKKSNLSYGLNYFLIQISPSQKTPFDVGILCNSEKINSKYKILNIEVKKRNTILMWDYPFKICTPILKIDDLILNFELKPKPDDNAEIITANDVFIDDIFYHGNDKNAILIDDKIILNSKKISIVMGYINRREQLETTLETFYRSKYKNFEIIVTDDGSVPDQRIDDFVDKYGIKLIKNDAINKTWCNPCVAYNNAIQMATGDILIIQNPEVCHIDDIIDYVANNLSERQYISFSCFASPNFAANSYLKKLINDNSVIDKSNLLNYFNNIMSMNNIQVMYNGWYNHPKQRPCNYHFCAATYRKNINAIRGFSAEYQNGYNADDKDLILKIRCDLKLQLVIVPPHIGLVVHQYHLSTMPKNEQELKIKNKINQKIYKNKLITKNLIASYTKNIPFVMNCYWANSFMPFINYLSIKSFMYYNPHWHINLYVPENFPKDKMNVADENYWYEIYISKNISVIPINLDNLSTNIKWHVLYNNGGVWSDLDLLYINSVENILLKSLGWHNFVIQKQGDIYFTKFILANKNNIIVEKMGQVFNNINEINISEFQRVVAESNIETNRIMETGINFTVPLHQSELSLTYSDDFRNSITNSTLAISFCCDNTEGNGNFFVKKLMEILNSDNFNKNISCLVNHI